MLPYLEVGVGRNVHENIKSLPESYTHYLFSDLHIGSGEVNDKALNDLLCEILDAPDAYGTILGDFVEGHPTNHPYYDHLTIAKSKKYDYHKPEGQWDCVTDTLRPLAEAGKLVAFILGNHDVISDRHVSFLPRMCKTLRVPFLGPMGFLNMGGVHYYLAHRGRMLTNSAGDEDQQAANRRTSCKRHFTRPAQRYGSAHGMFHGDTHQLELVPPAKPQPFLMIGPRGEHRMRSFDPSMGEGRTEEGFLYVPPDSRWYGVTGTFRRADRVVRLGKRNLYEHAVDYGPKAGYAPQSIGYIKLRVEKGRIVDGQKVYP